MVFPLFCNAVQDIRVLICALVWIPSGQQPEFCKRRAPVAKSSKSRRLSEHCEHAIYWRRFCNSLPASICNFCTFLRLCFLDCMRHLRAKCSCREDRFVWTHQMARVERHGLTLITGWTATMLVKVVPLLTLNACSSTDWLGSMCFVLLHVSSHLPTQAAVESVSVNECFAWASNSPGRKPPTC